MRTVAIYTRLSRDPTGEQTSTPRQERLCRSYADARGWQVAEVFEDVDISAYSGVHRPAFDLLCRSVEAGRCDGVLVWKLDRLVRRPSDFERFWSVCDRSRVFLASVTEPVDSSTELGVAIVRILVTFASLESSTISLRIKARLSEKAHAGAAPPGQRAFGFNDAWDEVIESEAALIREAARRYLQGETLRSIADDWTSRGVVGVRGGNWTGTQIRKTLESHRLVGDRSHHGVVVARDCFPPVLDRVTFERIRVARAQRGGTPPSPGRTYLLSSLLVCSECHGHLHGRATSPPTYFCSACRKVTISGPPTELLVTDLLFERLAVRRRQPRRPPTQTAVLALRKHADRLERLNHEYFAARTINREEFLQVRAQLGATMAEARPEPELAAHGLPRTFKIANASVAWPVLTVAQRRAVIRAEVAHAVVVPARSRKRVYDPTRVAITWKS